MRCRRSDDLPRRLVLGVLLSVASAAQAGPDIFTIEADASAVATDSQSLEANGTLQVRIRNIGDADAGAFEVLAFEDRNADGAFDAADLLLGQAVKADGLLAGAEAEVPVPVSGTVPGPPGSTTRSSTTCRTGTGSAACRETSA